MNSEKVFALIKSYADFPKPGILFRDIHPVMFDHDAREFVLQELVKRYKGVLMLQLARFTLTYFPGSKIDVVAGLDSRGYYFAVLLAQALKLPFFPIRKRGKLPGDVLEAAYGLEYGMRHKKTHSTVLFV